MLLPRQPPPGPMPALSPEFLAENNGPRIIIITSTITGISFLVVFLRVYVRAVMLKTVGSDDYTMIAAMVFAAGVLLCFVEEVKLGVGHHTAAIFAEPVLAANFSRVIEWLWIHALLNLVAIFFVKISVGLFLLRLVQGKGYKRFIIAMMIFLFFFTLACLGTLIFQCLPVRAIWESELQPPLGNARCYSTNVYRSIGLFNGSINIFTDVLFASLPIPIILTLQVNVRTKATLIAILSIGYFACIASVVREVLLANFFKDPDSTFNDTYVIWTAVETNVGILAACLPALRPLFARVLDTANNMTFRTTHSRRQTSKEQYFGQTSIRLSSINSGDHPMRKEKVFRGPMSRLEQSIGDMGNESEEYIISKGSDQRA
ncbi:hypothetical protein L207DRAFT_579565 [Hyaloscypha variabilis F]|uniref:Rhodopsin domain-containing protein n=1 Tax=Hyaloscypha variabilis (strain UAMH 11265 / GT02V1 / F) TaxID=1149755 RepID=A0A2J6S1I4_HYAVF|nr:hypothetical protein L207DRAFT_579565 [Hyaloscypha variabilis F]